MADQYRMCGSSVLINNKNVYQIYSKFYMCIFLLTGAPSGDPNHLEYVPSLYITAEPD